MEDRLADYKDVNERIVEFYERYPDGRLTKQGEDQLITIGDRVFVKYTAAAYRTADDPHPGVGTAWEPFPGRTPYTRDSELMNAETAAWGRAIVACGIIARNESIASRQEVRNRREEPLPPRPMAPAPRPLPSLANGPPPAPQDDGELDPDTRVCPKCGKAGTLRRMAKDPEKAFCAAGGGGCGKSFLASEVVTRAKFHGLNLEPPPDNVVPIGEPK